MSISERMGEMVDSLITETTNNALSGKHDTLDKTELEQAIADLEARQIPQGSIAMDVERLRECLDKATNLTNTHCKICPAKNVCIEAFSPSGSLWRCKTQFINYIIATLTADSAGERQGVRDWDLAIAYMMIGNDLFEEYCGLTNELGFIPTNDYDKACLAIKNLMYAIGEHEVSITKSELGQDESQPDTAAESEVGG